MVGNPDHGAWLECDDLWGLFQSKPFCDSMIKGLFIFKCIDWLLAVGQRECIGCLFDYQLSGHINAGLVWAQDCECSCMAWTGKEWRLGALANEFWTGWYWFLSGGVLLLRIVFLECLWSLRFVPNQAIVWFVLWSMFKYRWLLGAYWDDVSGCPENKTQWKKKSVSKSLTSAETIPYFTVGAVVWLIQDRARTRCAHSVPQSVWWTSQPTTIWLNTRVLLSFHPYHA